MDFGGPTYPRLPCKRSWGVEADESWENILENDGNTSLPRGLSGLTEDCQQYEDALFGVLEDLTFPVPHTAQAHSSAASEHLRAQPERAPPQSATSFLSSSRGQQPANSCSPGASRGSLQHLQQPLQPLHSPSPCNPCNSSSRPLNDSSWRTLSQEESKSLQQPLQQPLQPLHTPVVSTLAGGPQPPYQHDARPTSCDEAAQFGGYADGGRETARFRCPVGVAEAADGTIYVVDRMNHCLRFMGANGVWKSLCGRPGKEGYADGVGCEALFHNPWHVAVDYSTEPFDLIVSDMGNHCLRRVSVAGVVTTLAGAGKERGYVDGYGQEVRLNLPCGVAVDGAGNVVVADCGNHILRFVRRSDGWVTTVAGSAGAPALCDGVGNSARFCSPRGIALDAHNGIVYVADLGNHAVRSVLLKGGLVRTIAGAGVAGLADGYTNTARFKAPADVALDGAGIIVVADTGNHCIPSVTLEEAHLQAQFFSPRGIKVDSSGAVLVVDAWNHALRRIHTLLLPPMLIVAESSRCHDSLAMLSSKEYADVCFVFEQGTGTMPEILLPDIHQEAFGVVLKYLYGDVLDVPLALTVQVLVLADRFEIARLTNYCALQCLRSMQYSNAIFRLLLLKQSGRQPCLQRWLRSYIHENLQNITDQAPGTLHLLTNVL